MALPRVVSCCVIQFVGCLSVFAALSETAVKREGSRITLQVDGGLSRSLSIAEGNVTTTSFRLNGQELLSAPATELSFVVALASPNQAPVGIRAEESSEAPASAKEPLSYPMKLLRGMTNDYPDTQGVRWVDARAIASSAWKSLFSAGEVETYRPKPGVTRLVTRQTAQSGELMGLGCDLIYEIYEGFPVVRKWVAFNNRGTRWLKLEKLQLEGITLKPEFRHRLALAPGAVDQAQTLDLDPNETVGPDYKSQDWVVYPSVIAFSNRDASAGIIATSEIPSAMREIRDDGSMGYRTALFEWVLGPGESFVSEPVFLYGFSGETRATVSAISTPRDRAVEGSFQKFLSQHIGLAAEGRQLHTPVWNIWEVSWRHVNDALLRRQAAVAARCGFKQIEVDAGWQWDELDARIDTKKFPDFADTVHYLDSLGLKLSLWISNYRSEGSLDLKAHPDGRVVPLIIKDRKLGPGYGMSYASSWRNYFARDLISLHQQYGIIGFKEDHCNIRAGDIAFGHESRTRKESLLRGFRGMFEMQDMVQAMAPEVITNITHEVYWDRPNPGCDLAALKHGVSYHIPPNRHDGGEDVFMFKARGLKPTSEFYQGAPHAAAGAQARRRAFIEGCRVAREQFYAHRALPLRSLQFSALITINQDGSLATEVQDRQVCSLLMGSPLLFSGDLTTLSSENVERYADRFRLLDRLEKTYGIYRFFQFSGVPAPTDTDWHWWGKLNDDGCGAVVVLRGSAGSDQRRINIPWVHSATRYVVTAAFTGKTLGTFSGTELQDGTLQLALPIYGQEILEIAPLKRL